MDQKTTKISIKNSFNFYDKANQKGNEISNILELVRQKYSQSDNVEQYIKENSPTIPTYFFRPKSLKIATDFFKDSFLSIRPSSKILYSVKSNPDVEVLKILRKNGITNFDVASLNEVKLINSLFLGAAKMFFMHPIKSFEAISQSYFEFGIRDFSLDSFDELEKICRATQNAKDLNLHVRIAIPSSNSAIELSTKFGILPSESMSLVRKARTIAKKVGICFHVGSQCMDPIEYRKAIIIASDIVKKSQIKLDVLDIGGGFPAIYPTLNPPKLSSYFNEIADSLRSSEISKDCEIWCEPGRALVTEAFSLLVRVEARKNNMLYINDGTYGGLFDAGVPEFTYPARAIRGKKSNNKLDSTNLEAFGFYGPTCDSIDHMKGPFFLPANIQEGDYIEIGQLGSYSKSMRTNFNGFAEYSQVEVDNEPMISIFDEKLNYSRNEKNRST